MIALLLGFLVVGGIGVSVSIVILLLRQIGEYQSATEDEPFASPPTRDYDRPKV